MSSLIGTVGNLLGSAYSAAQNRRSAKRQMDFQERMSSTAYQRAASDLEAAGLNRIIALGSPASSPGGAYAQVPDFGASIQSGLNYGLQSQSTAADVAQKDASAKKIIQETKNLSETEKRLAAEGAFYEALTPHLEKGVDAINTLIEKMADPAFIADIASKVRNASAAEAAAWTKFLTQHLGNQVDNAQLTVSDWMSEVMGKDIQIGQPRPKE